MTTPTILLYDSGMGGLTIYDAIRQSLPNARYFYCFDNAYFPYSEKSEAVLIERAINIVQKSQQIQQLDMVVVACNTASTVVLPALREIFSFPIVGTVPAIKPAAQISHTKTIGLLATKGTVNRPYVDRLIDTYAHHCVVEKIGTTALVELVEEKQRTGQIDIACLAKIVETWQHHPSLDTVILGCTHFPLVKQELQQCLPNVRYFIDSGNGIANRVLAFFPNVPTACPTAYQSENFAFCTEFASDHIKREQVMKRWGFNQLEILSVE